MEEEAAAAAEKLEGGDEAGEKVEEPKDKEEAEEKEKADAEMAVEDVEEEEEEEEDIYIPQAEYTAVCNADFAPLICNDFVSEFMEKEHGASQLDRADAIDLTRNFCFWIA